MAISIRKLTTSTSNPKRDDDEIEEQLEGGQPEEKENPLYRNVVKLRDRLVAKNHVFLERTVPVPARLSVVTYGLKVNH